MSQIQIFVKNPYQNIGQTKDSTFSTNLSFNPTVEEFNRNSSSAGGFSDNDVTEQDDEDEPLFGTHIREAAGTLKKIFRRR